MVGLLISSATGHRRRQHADGCRKRNAVKGVLNRCPLGSAKVQHQHRSSTPSVADAETGGVRVEGKGHVGTLEREKKGGGGGGKLNQRKAQQRRGTKLIAGRVVVRRKKAKIANSKSPD
jgi:hypothetical protein